MIEQENYDSGVYSLIPEATLGNFSIVKDKLPKGISIRTYSPIGFFYHDVLASDLPFIKLEEKPGGVWMSDTPQEQNQVIIPAIVARGKVLMIGLGLGLFLIRAKKYNKAIKSITVVERSQDVASLVYPYVEYKKTSLMVCDGEKYLASCKEKYDFIYIDIWNNIIAPVREIQRWTSLAKGCLTPKGVVRCWLQELYDRVEKKLPKEPVERGPIVGIQEPCLVCGKVFRYDYAGLCADCADLLGVSEMFIKR